MSVSVFGDQISAFAIPLAAVLTLHASAAAMGLLTALFWLPHLLFSRPVGVWVDARPVKRKIMVAADLGRAALLATIPVAWAIDALSLPQLYVTVFLVGACAVFFDLAYSSNAIGQMFAGALPVLAFERYHDPKVAGWLFAAFGIGGLLGTVLAFRLISRVEPMLLAAVAIVGIALPLWVLPFRVPLVFILSAIVLSSLCNPSVNGPMIGAITKRTPKELLPKVMTAVLTLAMIAGPLGLLLGGWLLQHAGVGRTFAVIAGGETAVALAFAWLILRFRRAQTGQLGKPLATVIVSDSVP